MYKVRTRLPQGESTYILYDAFLPQITTIGRGLETLRTQLQQIADSAGIPYPLPSYSENLTLLVEISIKKLAMDSASISPQQWQSYVEHYLSARAGTSGKEKLHAGERSIGALDVAAELKILQGVLEKTAAAKYLKHGKHLNRKMVIALALIHTAQTLS